MVGKERLVFDPANASEGDKIAGYLYGAGGTLITSTTVGPDEGLDVNVLNTITVQATNLDIRDLSHTSDSVKVGDGTDFLAVNADGSINITDNGGSITVDGTVAATQSGTWTIDSITNPVTVTATNLDIRDLAFATDSVTAHQGGTWTIDSITNAVTVTATNLDIRDLSHTQDSVKIGDGTDFLAINADGSINTVSTGDPALANTALAAAATSVTTTATNLVASPLANRKYLFVQNLGNRSIYLGGSGVTVAQGFRLSPGAALDARIGAAVSLYAITDSGTQDVRNLELS
jgi:hypothetical protein